MSHESDRSGAGVGIAIAAALIVVVFGCILVAGAGLFLFRATAMQQQEAVIAQEAAMVQEQAILEARARQMVESVQLESELPATSILTIAIDAVGKIQLNGVETDLEQLRTELEEQMQNSTVGSVIVLPVAECEIEDVTKVLSLCMEGGVTDIQIRRNP